jgi:hypothetical protein
VDQAHAASIARPNDTFRTARSAGRNIGIRPDGTQCRPEHRHSPGRHALAYVEPVQDLAGLLDAHVCDPRCSRTTHTQTVLLNARDVASVAAELTTLRGVRELLTARGLLMLEGEPTPRFAAGEDGPRQWSVRYQPMTPAAAPRGQRPRRRGWWSRILDPEG